MTIKNALFQIALAVVVWYVPAQDIRVTNTDELNAALASLDGGGTILLANGVWKDVELKAYGNGTKENPVIIKAETPGKVIITGDSNLSIYGNFVIVSGLWFKDGNTTAKHVVQFRKDSRVFANNCRFANSTISYIKTRDADLKNHWVDIWGKNNRVDHNNFTGKVSAGTTLVVWLKGDEHTENNHKIDHNFFGARPDLGANGGESIRIGTSTNSMRSSKTIVENNVFKNCDGEIEIISNKSGDNIFRNNLFVESRGTLTLRHGNNALVENNVFLGNNVSNTGGIRIINEGHIVRSNLLVGLKGTGLRGPIVIMNGVPNSPLNRYHQVKDVDIQNNTIINCGPMAFGAGKDSERTLAPIRTVFANNIITNSDGGKILDADDALDGISFSGNIVDSQAAVDPNLFEKTSIVWKMVKSLPIPAENNPILTSVKSTPKSPEWDITKKERAVYAAGAFNLGSTKLPRAMTMRAGPGWNPDIKTPKAAPSEIAIKPGLGTLRKAIGKAASGSVISLEPGIYEIEKKIKINGTLTINGAKNGETLIKAKDELPKPIDHFFRLNENAKLYINNITFDGEHSSPMKYAIVSPDKQRPGLYSLFADHCVFKNFTNTDGGSIFKAYAGTKADTLSFVNSRFENSYRGLNLSYDKDDIGAFNANTIIVNNSVFSNIEQFAVNYVRTTPNVNIEGGRLIIDHCVFHKVANTEKGKILRTNGIHKVAISNSVFEDSYLIKNPVNLAGSSNSIRNCLFYDSGFVKVSKGAQEMNIQYKNPKWEDRNAFIPSEKSPLLRENNNIGTIGLVRE
ncbi:polysaccharide lyase 6 family protein [Sungkyunkwania multivorans]|uniref:Polysaccharide lyase 6 family protein n=1 Tax=Sungkyunkwania multivorans TaxID=1173618 RepID=A0ABW3CUX3_9FLAO